MNNRYQVTRFLVSVHNLIQLPPDEGFEVAFAGRSNVGKSSALNRLTQQKSLARISKTPGRTQLINFFQVEPGRHLVDLPGYGYAKAPESLRRHWGRVLERYLSERHALQGLFLLMDARHPFTPLDRQMLQWCQCQKLPVHVLLTKADKLKRGAALTCLEQVRRELSQTTGRGSVQLFSALKNIGVDEAHAKLDDWLGYSNNAESIPGSSGG